MLDKNIREQGEDDFKNALIISANLRLLLNVHKLNEFQLSKNTGINLSTVRRLVAGSTPDPRLSTLLQLCEYFNLTLDDMLSTNLEIASLHDIKSQTYFVPLLTWSMLVTKDSDDVIPTKLIPIILEVEQGRTRDLFAVDSTRSMSPSFPEGTIFIVDKSESAFDGDLVIINLKKQNSVTMRYLSIDGNDKTLLPIIASSSPFHFDETLHEIYGVVILTQNQVK